MRDHFRPLSLKYCVSASRLGRAASLACPDEVVGGQVEVDDLRSEGVRWSWCIGLVPCSSGVHCVEGVDVGDDVATVVRVFVVVERKEAVSRVNLRPAVTFVAGLPHGVVHETN